MNYMYASVAMVALALTSTGTSRAATSSPGLASCPATPPAPNALPRGARLLGSAPAATPLKYVSVINQSPAQVRPDGSLLEEIESESDQRPGVLRSSSWFNSSTHPVSLVCHYGGVGRIERGTAKLLVPLPANTKGECVVSSTLRGGRQGRPSVMCARAN